MLEQFGIINLWVYILGTLVLVLIPGPNSIFVLKTSLSQSKAEAVKAMLAVLCGDAILIFCAYLGIAAIIQAHPALFSAIKCLGAAYLAFLGARILYGTFFISRAERAVNAVHPKTNTPHSFRTALLLSLTNPKTILFYVSFFVQFIDLTYAHTWLSYLILAMILESFSVLYLSFLITVGAGLLRFVGHRPSISKLGNSAVGSLFLLFAGKLVLD